MFQSPLQKLAAQTTWAINFSLQKFNTSNISFPLSEETQRLIAVRNMTMHKLKASILADSDKEKARLLAEK